VSRRQISSFGAAGFPLETRHLVDMGEDVLRTVARSLVADPDEARIIEAVTKVRKVGKSHRAIAAGLSDAGLTPRTSGEWNPNQVRRIAQHCGAAER